MTTVSAPTAEFGIIGVGVMGRNLALNFNDHGIKLVIYDRHEAVTNAFLADEARDTAIIGAATLESFVAQLQRPRKILIMITAGPPVDSVLQVLLPLLDAGDIIIDGGNSHYLDTTRRVRETAVQDILFIGAGVSGGAFGARHGPSIMPGGAAEAWPLVKDTLQAIAAKAPDGSPCCDWVGEDGSGHFVKMVHNGIEYGDMQLIAEAYFLMKTVLGMSAEEMSSVFQTWNEGVLDSYLIEITSAILAFKGADGLPLVDKILDAAEQKGTGKWTAVSALDFAVPLTLISEAVHARFLSALKDERMIAEDVLSGPGGQFTGNKQAFINDIAQALYASKIISYTQGYMLFRSAAQEQGWNLNYGGIALMWREGCIIRAAFLDNIKAAFDKNPQLTNLLLDDYFHTQVDAAQAAWRRVVAQAAILGVPVPALSSALSFYDGYRNGRLPANLIQAQRDYFGAHTYERIDQPRGTAFHTDWIGDGLETAVDAENVRKML